MWKFCEEKPHKVGNKALPYSQHMSVFFCVFIPSRARPSPRFSFYSGNCGTVRRGTRREAERQQAVQSGNENGCAGWAYEGTDRAMTNAVRKREGSFRVWSKNKNAYSPCFIWCWVKKRVLTKSLLYLLYKPLIRKGFSQWQNTHFTRALLRR